MNDSEAQPSPLAVGRPSPAAGAAAEAAASLEQTHRGSLGAGAARLAPPAIAALVGAVSLLLPLHWSGLWAPYELEVADLSRRIAVALHGAAGLEVVGAVNEVPTLSDLGKGQLPFTSVAIGFQLFGLSDWAGRLPIALWALLGIAATYLLIARFIDRVAATYAACALATTPLYFLHARTMLGDGVTLATAAIATAGLAVATFDPGVTKRSALGGWCALGVLGLASGFVTRGVLFGVACPALGVGLAWGLWRVTGHARAAQSGNAVGAASLVLGLIALAVGCYVLAKGSPDIYLELLGARPATVSKLPTHDAVLHQLGFGLLPWSALAPFALALGLYQPDTTARDVPLRVCLVTVFGVATLVHGLSAPHVGTLPFVGTFALAAAVGIAFRDAEKRALGTRLVALAAAAILIVSYSDLRGSPEQALGAFAISEAKFPESFADEAKRWMKYGILGTLAVMLIGLGELPGRRRLALFHPESDYARWLGTLRGAWGGRLPWLLVGVTVVLALVPLLMRLRSRGIAIPFVDALIPFSDLLRGAFYAVPALVLLPLAVFLGRDVLGLLLERLPIARARLAFIAFAAFGIALSLGYYPALASHLSPRNVFESFQERARPGDALAVIGQAARVAPYYATGQVHTPASARAGLDWLLESSEQRRFLVLGARDLGQLNQLYRQRMQGSANLPILDATSSETLLASNQLDPGEVNQNPFAAWVSRERPEPERPLANVELNGQLRCLGWGLTDKAGRPVTEARTGVPYDFKIYWEVLAPINGNWQTFIHIDGHRRRHNGDHDTLQGRYPFRFWQKGDFMTDVYELELEPHFAGATYQVYFGLFSGDKRLEVKSGRHHDNRIMAGNLIVR